MTELILAVASTLAAAATTGGLRMLHRTRERRRRLDAVHDAVVGVRADPIRGLPEIRGMAQRLAVLEARTAQLVPDGNGHPTLADNVLAIKRQLDAHLENHP
ncbi:hypothetical protein [Frankia sp. Cr1]|uniref:hypothetical protein n=1 Tax=Frankia sp. Cr1 TaxID=3073931 RepID=UPI002AD3F810|nr:hypothetical protein [Frankia sp. Cr1]